MPIIHHHHRDFDYSPSKERRHVYMAGAAATVGSGLWRATKFVGKTAFKVASIPFRMAWYGVGGPMMRSTVKLGQYGFEKASDGVNWTRDRVGETLAYGKGIGKGVARASVEAPIKAAYKTAVPFAEYFRYMLLNTTMASAKTQWNVAKMPINFLRGVGELGHTFLDRPFNIARSLATLQFREAYQNVLDLRPISILRGQTSIVDATRDYARGILAPVTRPTAPVVAGVRDVGSQVYEAHRNFATRFGEAIGHVRNAAGMVLDSPSVGREEVAIARAGAAERNKKRLEDRELFKSEVKKAEEAKRIDLAKKKAADSIQSRADAKIIPFERKKPGAGGISKAS